MPPVSLTWQALKAVADGDGEALADGEADGDGEVAADGAGEAPPPHAAATIARLPSNAMLLRGMRTCAPPTFLGAGAGAVLTLRQLPAFVSGSYPTLRRSGRPTDRRIRDRAVGGVVLGPDPTSTLLPGLGWKYARPGPAVQ